MKIVVNAGFLFLMTLLLAACAGGGGSNIPLSNQDAAQLMSVTDNTVVPGVRAGRVFLGMTEEQLYQRMGTPQKTNGGDVNVIYLYQDLIVWVKTSTHRVFLVYVEGPSYSTAQGVSVGMPELAAKATLGPPSREGMYCGEGAGPCSDGKGQSSERFFCYDSGLQTNVNGTVITMMLFSGRCDE